MLLVVVGQVAERQRLELQPGGGALELGEVAGVDPAVGVIGPGREVAGVLKAVGLTPGRGVGGCLLVMVALAKALAVARERAGSLGVGLLFEGGGGAPGGVQAGAFDVDVGGVVAAGAEHDKWGGHGACLSSGQAERLGVGRGVSSAVHRARRFTLTIGQPHLK